MTYSDHFSIANIPYGIASTKGDTHREPAVATRLGDKVIFLNGLKLDVSSAVKEALSKVRFLRT
jgi:fumarylacetoacetase